MSSSDIRYARRCAPRQAMYAFAWVLALTSAPVVAQGAETLTLEAALRIAEDRSPQLRAQDAATFASREMAVAARQLPDPVLKAGINNLPIDGSDRFSLTRDFMTMRSVGLMQELTRDEKRRARASRFEREAEVAQAGRSVALANLRRDTALAWLDRHAQERTRGLLDRQREEAQLQIEASEAAYRGGRGSQADVLAARSYAALLEDRIAQTERQIATARIQLARWVGDAAYQRLGDAPRFDAAPITVEDLETRLLHLPQIAVLRSQEQMARADAEVARANRRTDWSVELMYNQRGSAYSNMVSLNVSVPLQWDQKSRQDRELAAKLAIVEQVEAQREEATRALVAELRAMLQEWQVNQERLARYDHALIPLVDERIRASLAAYRGGAGTLTSVLESRRSEIDIRMERVRLELETARLWAQLNYLIPASHDAAATLPSKRHG